jgi:hypothetical protein
MAEQEQTTEPGHGGEAIERIVSLLMRLLISLALPTWALAMLAIGIRNKSPWWIGCGLAVGAVGLLFFVGSPLTDPLFKDRSI